MIILILLIMIISAIVFIFTDRKSLSNWMSGIFIGSILTIVGFMYYYAKSGGLSRKVQVILFFHDDIQRKLLYSTISMDNISRMISIGRSVFMFFSVGFAINIFYNRAFKENKKLYLITSILPIINAVIYEPTVYRILVRDINRNYQNIMNSFTRIWTLAYILLTIYLLARKHKKVSIPWIRNKLKYIFLVIISLEILFFALGVCGPLQVAEPIGLTYIYSSLSHYSAPFTLLQWYIIIFLSAVFIIIGANALWSYSKIEMKIGKPDLLLERKLKTAHMGVRVFTHGIKNQLLAARVILKHINKTLSNEEIDIEKVKKNITNLQNLNEQMLSRMDVLYTTFKSNTMHLKPISVQNIIKHSVEKINKNSTTVDFKIGKFKDQVILADSEHLTEAIYNIINNAFDAAYAKQQERGGIVTLNCYTEAAWCIFEIKDNGIGIEKYKINKIFDPFYTEKNTNSNWGLGLSYVQQIVKAHFGYIRIESEVNKGTTFYIFIPIYRTKINKEFKDELLCQEK